MGCDLVTRLPELQGSRIARDQVSLKLEFGEMLEMLGPAEKIPTLQRPVGRLLTAEGRHCPVTTHILHENLSITSGLFWFASVTLRSR
jgi:hypothetical protein